MQEKVIKSKFSTFFTSITGGTKPYVHYYISVRKEHMSKTINLQQASCIAS
jgi:hypothetical protein